MSICCNLVNIKSYQLHKLVIIAIPQYSYSTKYPTFNHICAEVSGGLPSSMKLIIECVQFVQVSFAEPRLLKKQDVTFFKKFIDHQTSALSVALCPVHGPCATYDTTQILLFVSAPKR